MSIPTANGQTVSSSAVLAILANHRGRARPVKAAAIAAQLGLRGRYADRPVRDAIRTLRNEGHVILSATHKPMGYFMCASRQEWQQYGEPMSSRATDLLVTIRAMRRAVDAQFAPEPSYQRSLW